MTKANNSDLVKIRRALISVSDKTGIVDFARELKRFSVEIISTGGTAKALRDAGLAVRDVSDVTGFPEVMDGRIKTLHRRIHGGLLAIRDNFDHLAAMAEHNIEPIDMVVVDLYPFAETSAREGVTLAEAIEQIDIGGPAMIRSAAKNFASVAAVAVREIWPEVIGEMMANQGALSLALRHKLAGLAFATTFAYDAYVSSYLLQTSNIKLPETPPSELPSEISLPLDERRPLRYGEKPHQPAALYELGGSDDEGVAGAELLSGKERSFNT